MSSPPLHRIDAPPLGRQVVFGRRRPSEEQRRNAVRLNRYVRSLEEPPSPVDYSMNALAALRDVFLNDELGDCVVAAGHHIQGIATGNAGDLWLPTHEQIVADYSAIGGYVPGQPETDQGCDMQIALRYWTERGFDNGTKLLGWLAVDAANVTLVKQAIFLFQHLFLGAEMPDSWVNPFPEKDGFVWDLAGPPNPNNGHAFCAFGYSDEGVFVDSWGMGGLVTWPAFARYLSGAARGECYVMLTPDQIAKGRTTSPAGFEWSSLVADFKAMGGHVPLSADTERALEARSGSGVTLAQAQAWAASGLENVRGTLTRTQAANLVSKGLANGWPKD